jgi:hypothetical protein
MGMKGRCAWLWLAVVSTAGCASAGHEVVLAPVGPAPSEAVSSSPHGTLVVHSAFDPNAHFNSLPYTRFYTDYRIFSKDGKLVQAVQNNPSPSVPGPVEVKLPPGKYRVVARANGYGKVTVPVTVAAGEVTVVHLNTKPQNRSE